jgi:membrane-bound lytic murein transglycosylase D
MKKLPCYLRHLISVLALPTLLSGCAAPHKNEVAGAIHSVKTKYVIFHVRPRGKKMEGDDAPAQDELDDVVKYVPKSAEPSASDARIFEKILNKRGKQPSQPLNDLQARLRKGGGQAALPPAAAYRYPLPQGGKFAKGGGLWARVRRNLQLAGIEHESVLAEIARYTHSPGSLNFLMKRAEPYLHFIVDEIERRQLPMDLVITPMVESAFDPAALSPKQAAGLWQFVPSTAVDYGLTVNENYDARYDFQASTKAALSYLSHLHKLFKGDWLLALAAYNAGEGAVQRAVQANQKAGLGVSFWDLSLPSETKAYVPKIVALSRLIADPTLHGVKLRAAATLPPLARLEINAATLPGQWAAAAGMDWEAFHSLNPALKPDAAPPQPCNLLLPPERAEALVLRQPGVKILGSRHYVARLGDTLPTVAKRQGVPRLKLALWNGLKADSALTPGQAIMIRSTS